MDGLWLVAAVDSGVGLFGVRLVGVNAENGAKLIMTVAFVLALVLLGRLLRWVLSKALGQGRATDKKSERARFWSTQGVHLFLAAAMVLGLISIWFDDPSRFATFGGLFSAGIAFALQRVITAFAGYFVILRGKTFNVGDRITMGNVHGDVVALGFMQTTIMEMGQPPSVNAQDKPGMWVRARQYSGRLVTVTNDKIFDEAVYNYTRDFPYIWEEMTLPIGYKSDWRHAERILVDAAKRQTVAVSELGEAALAEIERRYYVKPPDIVPRVYLRLTDNWVELTVRFLVLEHGIREVKDAMNREVVQELERAGIEVASGTYDIVGFPPVRIEGLGALRDVPRRGPSGREERADAAG